MDRSRSMSKTAARLKGGDQMKITTETLQSYAENGKYRRVPISRELYADAFTPVEVMRTLRAASRHCYLLESAEDKQRWGRYSFLGYAPTMEITCTDGHVTITEGAEEEEKTRRELNTELRERCSGRYWRLQESGAGRNAALYRRACGVFLLRLYKIRGAVAQKRKRTGPKRDGKTGQEFRDMDLMLFDKVIVFDNYRQKLILITGISLAGDPEENYRKALQELDDMERLIKSGAKADFRPLELEEPKPEADREITAGMVEKAKEYIRDGDIFQVVLSNPMTAKAKGSLFDTYRVLRTTNPVALYVLLLKRRHRGGRGRLPRRWRNWRTDGSIHSPLRAQGRGAAQRRKTGGWKRNSCGMKKSLQSIICWVDLGRNDIGKISKPGTVQVEKYMEIQRFSHVMHIGSTVSGEIRQEKDGVGRH